MVEDAFSHLTRWSSEVLVEARRARATWNVRMWYENPDAVRGAPGAEALVGEAATAHSEAWLSPWLGRREAMEVRWLHDDRAVVEARFLSAEPSGRQSGEGGTEDDLFTEGTGTWERRL
jgi:hypothetical protein